MMDMMKQARDLQKKMKKIQKKVESAEITATAGGGMVTVVVNGSLEVKKLSLEDSLVAGGDARMIEDLVLSAVNGRDEGRDRWYEHPRLGLAGERSTHWLTHHHCPG
jgi:DNA-binding YbaB/EbfC family protein